MGTTADKLQRIIDSKAAIKEAIESKEMTVGNAPLKQYSQKIRSIRLGIPISLDLQGHVDEDGHWVHPSQWPDIEALQKENDTLYFTIDNSGRIDFPFFSFVVQTINASNWEVAIGTVSNGVFTAVVTESVAHSATFSTDNFSQIDSDYPVVRVKAEGGISRCGFKTFTSGDGRSFVERANAVVHATGHMSKRSNSSDIYSTYWLERDSRVLGWTTDNCLNGIWYSSYSLQSLDVSGWDTSEWFINGLYNTWSNCLSLQRLDLSYWDTSNWAVDSLNAMCSTCISLENFNTKGWNTSNWAVTSIQSAWYNCYSLQKLDLSHWNTSNWRVSNMYATWTNCYSLRSLNINNWDTSGWVVTNFNGVWNNDYSLQSLDISGWDTSNWTATINFSLFSITHSLRYLNISGFDLSKITSWASGSSQPISGFNTLIIFGSNNDNKIVPSTNIRFTGIRCLPRQTMLNLFAALGTTTTARTIELGSEALNKLTTAEKAIATNKGYTLA